MSKFFNKYIILVLGFYVLWLGVLPQVLSNVLTVLCKNFSHNSDYKIEVVNPRIRTDILPVIRFYANSINISSKTGNLSTNIENFKIKFRLLPLLSGRFHINSVRADMFVLHADLKKDVELDKDFFNKLENTKVYCDSLKISRFDTFLYQSDTKNPIVYSGKDFVFKNKNRYAEFNVKSSLTMNGKTSNADVNLFLPINNDLDKTVFDVNIKNLDISPFRIYFKHYLPKDLLELNGVINISADKNGLLTELKNCSVIMKDTSNSVVFPALLTIKSKFKIKRNYINFESIEAESDNVHISSDGRISDYLGKAMPTLDINIRVNQSRAEDIINFLPSFVTEEINIYKLKKYKFYGDVLANVSIKGRLPEPDVTGSVFVNNGVLTKPIPNAVSGAKIKISLTGKYANFDVFVPAGGSESVSVNGGVELYNVKYADLNVKSTQNVNLLSAEEIVNPLHEILNFVIGPVPIMHIPEGTGNIDIIVKGNRKNPHVWGVLNFYNTSVKFKEIPDLLLKNADAVLNFNDRNAVFKTLKGQVNGKDFNVSGTCDVFGKFDFDVYSQNQPVNAMYKALSTATLLSDVQKMIPKPDRADGLLDLTLKVYGSVKNIEDLRFNENCFAKGEIDLKNNNYIIQKVKVNNANGKIKLDGNSADVNISASISNAPMSIKAKVKNNIGDLVLNIPKLNPNYLLENNEKNSKNRLPFVSIFLKYKGDIHNIEYDKINLSAKILDSSENELIKYTSGEINMLNNKLLLKNIKGFVKGANNPFSVDLKISDPFSSKQLLNGNIYIKTPDISVYNDLVTSGIIPKNVYKHLKDYEFQSGALTLNLRVNDNKFNADTELNDILINYLPLNLPIKIINGKLSLRNNVLYLNKVNILADKMPVLADGEIKNIFNRQFFNLYINSKPQQEFIDKYINKNQIYPVKIKGDIVYWIKLKGNLDNLDVKTQFNLKKESYFYYLGATVGDVENAISLYIDSKITGKNIKIREFAYDKIIESLSGRQTKYNMLNASGGVELIKDDLLFRDLHIKTSQPTDAKIFNIIFRKPNIKQGLFTSDLKINNKLSNPRVLGTFKLFETDIPFIDASVKNIELTFKDRIIDITSHGEVMGNDVSFEGVMKNRLTIPYHFEKGVVYTKDFDLNRISAELKASQIEPQTGFSQMEGFDLKLFTADNFKIKADIVELRNIHATDFDSEFSISDKGVFDVHRFRFNIAQGTLGGKYKYNLNNNDISLSVDAESINANDITLALFDLRNQIYGDMTGKISLSCNGKDFRSCMTTLSGSSVFNVKNGRMPKLGSLEYLLKAGNLVKGGITGLSINSVIDLITPLKTGEFSDIFGSITIADGLANDIEIITKGKDLNLFISGTYNFATENAEMEVLGLLSRKISTMFGPIGNMSVNTLFNVIPGIDLSKDSPILEKINKIPGVEFSSKSYRKFLAEIRGNINGENYVTTFSWVN